VLPRNLDTELGCSLATSFPRSRLCEKAAEAYYAAIDGSKIEAAASRKQVIAPASLEKAEAALGRKIASHLEEMDKADRENRPEREADADRNAVGRPRAGRGASAATNGISASRCVL